MISYMTTLANGVIGVSVLAMPYCFKQCGIILATIMLLLSSILSRLACYFLIKSAVMLRRRNYEFLAFHAFGSAGKILVELLTIGFLLGTCVAYFVVIGDLGPEILGKIINRNPEDIRTSLLITSAVFIVFPLGLLRNIDSLSSVCTATIVFYVFLVLKVISESTSHVLAKDWYTHVHYWRPAGILQCVPIFSMALFCQTQLFEIYDTIPNATLDKMNAVVKGALNICTSVYLCVGFFGYIAFCTQPFTGNILMSFEPNLTSEAMKIGFVFSVAFSFPLVIFPCRASLNSLLYRRVPVHDTLNYIPETRFRCLTSIIVGISLLIGILIPNIEFVLGLLGSTIGVMICLIFPATFFITINSKNTNEKFLAHFIILIAIWILTLGTYANLYAMEESTNTKVLINTNDFHNQIYHISLNVEENVLKIPELKGNKYELNARPPNEKNIASQIYPKSPVQVTPQKIDKPKDVPENAKYLSTKLNKMTESLKDVEGNKKVDAKVKSNKPILHANDLVNSNLESLKKERDEAVKEAANEDVNNANTNNNLIDSDAIQKEESELAAEVDQQNLENLKDREELRKTLEKYNHEQMKILNETKEILEDIKVKKKEWEEIHKADSAKEVDNREASGPKKQPDLTVMSEGNNDNNDNDNNNNLPKKVQDHILGALTKGLNREDLVKNSTIEGGEKDKLKMEVKSDTKSVDKDKETVPIPIVLKMNNQTIKMKSSTASTDVVELSPPRRDLLHKHDRGKRNAVNVSNVNIVSSQKEDESNVSAASDCPQRDNFLDKEDLLLGLNDNTYREVGKKDETKRAAKLPLQNEAALNRLIKTNAYLSQQDFTDKTISVTSDVILDTQFTKLKKRDLKALKPDNDST